MLKNMIETIIPKIVKVRREKNCQNPLSFPTENDDLVNDAVSWWKNDQYAKVKRFRHVRWLGRTIFKLPYYETIEGNYFKPSDDIVNIIKEIQKAQIVPYLNKSSKIFEPGCNVGRNLFSLQEAFDCEVVGLDISEKAIDIAQNKIWKQRSRYTFYVDNALTTNFFNNIADNAFDLVITRWHLIHIPRSSEKAIYVKQLKRIGKVLVLLEPVKEGCHEVQLYSNGTYTLSWDDWGKEYGLKEFHPDTISLEGNTKIFFFKNEDSA